MKHPALRHTISVLLTLALVVGMFAVCGAGALAEEKRALRLQTFGVDQLLTAAQASSQPNEKGSPIFTSYGDVYGRKSTSAGNFILHSFGVQRTAGGQTVLYDGGSLLITIRLSAEESLFFDGTLCQLEFIYGVDLSDQYLTSLEITYEDYHNAETKIDPTYGYEYKEFNMIHDMNGPEYDTPSNPAYSGQLRVMGRNEATVSVYYLSCEDANTETMLAEYQGYQLGMLPGTANYFENLVASDDPVALVSYCGIYPDVIRSPNAEPYCYNALGADTAHPAVLMNSLGATLAPGDYAFDFNMATVHALTTTDKCRYTVYNGDTKLTSVVVTADMVNQTVGQDRGEFFPLRVPFTVPEGSEENNITFQVELFDSNDYYLKDVSLYQLVDASTPVPAEAQAVIEKIEALTIDQADGIADAKQSYDGLSDINKAWVGDELAAKLSRYVSAQTDAAALIAEITAVGNADDITWENYTDYTDKLAAAENSYKNFVNKYGEEDTAKLIANADELADLRSAYDAAEEEAKEKEKAADIKAVEDLIDAIGEVTPDNYNTKKEPIEAAEAALAALKVKYGDDVQNSVTNVQILIDLRNNWPIDPPTPDVLYGDVNNDQAVDATDALWVLQHSVELRTLTETELKAADVTDLGKVDTKDALQILQKTVELIDRFDVEKDSFPG